MLQFQQSTSSLLNLFVLPLSHHQPNSDPLDGVTHSRIPTLYRRDDSLSPKSVPQWEAKVSIPPRQPSSSCRHLGKINIPSRGRAPNPPLLHLTSFQTPASPQHSSYQSTYENKTRSEPRILDFSHRVCSLRLPESTRMAVYYLIVNYTFLLDFRG